MDLFEYQAKILFSEYGLAVAGGQLARSAAVAQQLATEIAQPVVIKAQVKTGGRGKAGGIKFAANPQAAFRAAKQIIGSTINKQLTEMVQVSRAYSLEEEFYVAILLDRKSRSFLAICSAAGGMEIEDVARKYPQQLVKIPVSILDGLSKELAFQLAAQANIPLSVRGEVADILEKLWNLVVQEEALLAEINPLALTNEGKILALDGKVTLDDNASFRQEHAREYMATSTAKEDNLEKLARQQRLNYVKLTGEVGIIGNGAGLVMSTLDIVTYAGEKLGKKITPANFLDIGGGATAETMQRAVSLVLSDPAVKSVFINIFGGITANDQVAKGILAALSDVTTSGGKPIVVRLAGNNSLAGLKILSAAAHPQVRVVDSMDTAAEVAVKLAGS